MTNEPFDVLIVGSGHAGGMAAKILTESGIRCLMLNAGPVPDVPRAAQDKHSYELPSPRPPRACLPGERIQRQRMGRRAGSSLHLRGRPALQLGTRAALWRPIP